MYHFQYAKTDFREIRLPDVWRVIASFSHKIILAVQESRTREAKRIIAQYQNHRASMFSKFD